MKFSVSHSSLLTAIVIAALVVTVPFAVAEFFCTGELYLFSHRFLDVMAACFHGPGKSRFIPQPIVAMVFGARDGLKDARAGRLPFVWGLMFSRSDRAEMVRSALRSIRDLIAVAILLDVVLQLLIFRMVHPAAALLTGSVLIAFPYSSARALTNGLTPRPAHRW